MKHVRGGGGGNLLESIERCSLHSQYSNSSQKPREKLCVHMKTHTGPNWKSLKPLKWLLKGEGKIKMVSTCAGYNLLLCCYSSALFACTGIMQLGPEYPFFVEDALLHFGSRGRWGAAPLQETPIILQLFFCIAQPSQFSSARCL